MADDYEQPVVIDNGTGSCKVGFADEDAPRLAVPSVVGYSNNKGSDYYIGRKLMQTKEDGLSLKYPIEKGIITNWDEMEKIWQHIFDVVLAINPKEHAVTLTEPPLNPKENREKMTEIMFEKFKVPALYISNQAVLSLYASARTTGVALDTGHGVTHAVPVYEGYTVPEGIIRMNLGGEDLTKYMLKILRESGHPFTTPTDDRIVQDMKEKMCFVAKNFEAEMQTASTNTSLKQPYHLPDGKQIVVTTERFRCPEVLFNTGLIHTENASSIQKTIRDSIVHSDVDLHRDLYGNILLSGGNSLFPGIAERLHTELKKSAPDNMNIKIVPDKDRKYSVWIGGAIMSSNDSFHQMCISKEEYEDTGPTIVHQKCF